MKRYSGILLTILVAATLAQLLYAHVELRYNCEVLALQVKGESDQCDQLGAILMMNLRRTCRDAQKIAELEAKIKALTAEKPNQLTTGRLPQRFSETVPRLPGVFTAGSFGFPN